MRLLFVLVRLVRVRLDGERVPAGEAKARIISAVERARRRVPLCVALRSIGLSASRYHAWVRLEESCELEDRTSCPRTIPGQLTAREVAAIEQMVTGNEYRHMPLRALALHAQRIGRVFASPTTWARLVRKRGWRSPLQRVFPPRPKEDVRATRPGELLHIDVTIIRLLDGTRAFLHGVIDNYSRKILAWRLARRLDPATTCEVLIRAGEQLPTSEDPATVYADSGVENVNGQVDGLLSLGKLRRVLAQVEVSFSNSMIEAWWRSLKHNWLYLNELDSFAAVERLVGWYVHEHNQVIPHAAFRGQTPDEVFAGGGDQVPRKLRDGLRAAHLARLQINRGLSCEDCRVTPTPGAPAEPLPRPDGEAV